MNQIDFEVLVFVLQIYQTVMKATLAFRTLWILLAAFLWEPQAGYLLLDGKKLCTFRRVEAACIPEWFTELSRGIFDVSKTSILLHYNDQTTLFEGDALFCKTSFWLSWQLMYGMVRVDSICNYKDCQGKSTSGNWVSNKNRDKTSAVAMFS